jgi:hypothetical protein
MISSPEGISRAGFASLGSSSTTSLAPTSPPPASVMAGAGVYLGTGDMMADVVAGFVFNTAASDDFSGSRARTDEALPGYSKLRAEDILHAKSNCQTC